MAPHRICCFLSTLFVLCIAHANRYGGELRYTHISGLTYGIEVRLYSSSFSPPDAPWVLVYLGDGAVDTVPPMDSEVFPAECGDQLRIYSLQHTYSGPGIYSIHAWTPNREPGILNLEGSAEIPLCVDAMLLVSPGLENTSPVFANPLVFSYYAGQVLTHELQPYDADGDSLVFELVAARGFDCSPIPSYTFPDVLTPGPDTATVNSAGLFQWNAPQLSGFFTIAILCTEWRDGQMIGAVTRDMMLCVSASFTSFTDRSSSPVTISQASLDGPVVLGSNAQTGSRIDILDTRGALLNSLRPTSTRTLIATDAMATGMYVVIVSDEHGSTTTGRFIVAR